MAPPKNKGGNKKSKGAADEDGGGGSSSKPKAAQSINVRHILVGTLPRLSGPDLIMLTSPCQPVRETFKERRGLSKDKVGHQVRRSST